MLTLRCPVGREYSTTQQIIKTPVIEDQLLDRLDAASAQALAEMYSELAGRLLRAAARRGAEAAERQRLRRRRSEARAIVESIERFIGARGVAAAADQLEAAALADAGRRFEHWPPEIIARLWQQHRRSPAALRRRRDLEILRLAARPGWTVKRLGAKFDLDKGTISRIITRQLGHGPRRRQKKKDATP